MNNIVEIYDSTLRDGAQAEGISFSLQDKIKIINKLDKLGVAYIEAGNPASNPKDLEMFKKIPELKNSKLVAFGSTRRKKTDILEDENIRILLDADTEYIAIFGKSSDMQVINVIDTTLDENLLMIEETIRHFVRSNKKVIYDAEHFFDGYKSNKLYAVKTIEKALLAGASKIVLCDTNGGTLPKDIYKITKLIVDKYHINVGIHCHNDSGLAVANSMVAVEAGATQVQGTYLGFGERCGNTNLTTLICNLQLKQNYSCIPSGNIKDLTMVARYIGEISNIQFNERAPYVGRNAFSHKGGMHIDGVNKTTNSFEHIEPSTVGNDRRFLVSEMAGRSSVVEKIKKFSPNLDKNSIETEIIVKKLKELENSGYEYEGAESSFELIVRKYLGKYKTFFELDTYKIIGQQPASDNELNISAMVKIRVGNKYEITAAEGDGPVHALDKALRKALAVFYPELSKVYLIDYKVRVLGTEGATASKVRVLIESTDGINKWSTVGVSTDIIEASLKALIDSIEVKLYQDYINSSSSENK